MKRLLMLDLGYVGFVCCVIQGELALNGRYASDGSLCEFGRYVAFTTDHKRDVGKIFVMNIIALLPFSQLRLVFTRRAVCHHNDNPVTPGAQ